MSSKVNTLFAYFTKSPAPNKGTNDEKNVETKYKNSATPKRRREEKASPTQHATKSPPLNKGKPNGNNSSVNTSGNATPKKHKQEISSPTHSDKSTSPSGTFKIGDLVWAKLEGYPWWPSLVCQHPVDKVHLKSKPFAQVHVQFFDDPPTRSWIKSSFVKSYKGSDSYAVPPNYARAWRKACETADKALEMKSEDRMMLITELQPSDEENEDASVDLSDAEVDNEMSVDESPTSAECGPSSLKENGESSRPAKRRRIIVPSDDSDSDAEFKPDEKVADVSDDSVSSGVPEDISDIEANSEPDSPVKKKTKRISTPNPSREKKTLTSSRSKQVVLKRSSPTISKQTKSRLSLFAADESLNNSTCDASDDRSWPHLSFEFLEEEKIKDAKKRPRSHPDYDPKTLYVPESFKSQATPGSRQWWEIKANHFDVILFFKVGKFYEIFHMDAVTCVKELGLIYMKGDCAHVGFPEIAYARYADTLIQKGYKVARIEQMETPQMMEERCKKLNRPTKFDRVVLREVCRITTKGTRTCSFMERETLDPESSYLLAVAEKSLEGTSGNSSIYGMCFIDTSIGKFHLGQFHDDRHGSRFRTLISHFTPTQVLFEKGKTSVKTQQIITNNVCGLLKEALVTKTEFWEATKTLKFLSEGEYLKCDKEDGGATRWPPVLKNMLAEGDSLGLTAKKEFDLAVRSLGACIWYLSQCKLEHELLSLGVFEKYEPPDVCNDDESSETEKFPGRMILDGVTLRNLDVVQNGVTGTLEGTLLKVLDHCSTPFGKRLLHQWLCAPLCHSRAINDRLNAIDELLQYKDVFTEVIEILKKLPDLERLLSKIHTQGSIRRGSSHPDSRAIFFEAETYSKRKIEAFLAALTGFKCAVEIIELFQKCGKNFKSSILKNCTVLVTASGQFPDLSKTLKFFDGAFNHEKARKEGKIVPAKGVDDEYDEAIAEIRSTTKDLDDYLEKQKIIFNCKVVYFGTGKNRFQIEVPDSATKRATEKHELQSQRKGFKRYWTDTIKKLLNQLMAAEERRDAALQDSMRRIFAKFDEHYKKWESAVHCLAVLDVLCNLAEYSRVGAVTRPEIVMPVDGTDPFIEIRGGWHPCVTRNFCGDDFIPNDILIGVNDDEVNSSNAKIVVVTGPNMGGKSTLMRQVGLIVIMAQMGCYVPADKCRLSPIDRIFTRLGASDRIMSGESTFFVELSETSAVLSHATKHSLILMDELGRGTATYDGTAIACAVVKELTEAVRCRTLFSTHYHSLVEEFGSNPFIQLGHMSCMVENENEEDPTEETITFLYKFAAGACPKSYGFNAARLASIPDEIIKVGYSKAKMFEKTSQQMKQFRCLMGKNVCVEDIAEIKKQLQH